VYRDEFAVLTNLQIFALSMVRLEVKLGMLYFSLLLHCVELTWGFLRRQSATSFVVPLLDTVSLHVSG
jgi:hypothetical protein